MDGEIFPNGVVNVAESSLPILPTEILILILDYLPKRDLKFIAASLRAFRDDAQRRMFWHGIGIHLPWSLNEEPSLDDVRAVLSHEIKKLEALRTNGRLPAMVQAMTFEGVMDCFYDVMEDGPLSQDSEEYTKITNAFFSTVSSSYCNMTHLTLGNVFIDDETVSALGELESLHTLFLQGCYAAHISTNANHSLSLKSLEIDDQEIGLGLIEYFTPRSIQRLVVHSPDALGGLRYPSPIFPELTSIDLWGIQLPEDILCFISENCPKVTHIALDNVHIMPSHLPTPRGGLFPTLTTFAGPPNLLIEFSHRSPLPPEITFMDVFMKNVSYELHRDHVQETLNRDGVRNLTTRMPRYATSNDEDERLEDYGSLSLAAYETRYRAGAEVRVSEAIQAINARLSQKVVSALTARETHFFTSCIKSPTQLNIPSLETLCIEYPVDAVVHDKDSPAVPTRPRKHTLLAALDYVAAAAWMNKNPNVKISFVQVPKHRY